MEQKNWINEVFESTNGMHKAEPSPFLFEQVTARIAKGNTKPGFYGSPALRWGLAVFVSAIISINMIAIVKDRKASTETVSDKVVLADSYFNNETVYNY